MGNQGRARYSDSVVNEFIALRTQGVTNLEACARVGGINKKTGEDWWRKHKTNQARRNGDGGIPPKTLAQIRKHSLARRAHDDFAYFRLLCFGYKTPPAALRAVEALRASVEEKRRSFVLLNVFPGWGKSSLMMHFCCWMIVRNRHIRIMWGSSADHNAAKWVREARAALMRTEPDEGNPIDIARGRAVKPRYCMVDLFGRFRPSAHHGLSWTEKEFTVASPGNGINGEGPPPSGPTMVSISRRKKFVGKRAELAIWDDVWTTEEEENPDQGRAVKRWYDSISEERVQPEGTLVLVMQRLGPNDLSRHVLSQQVPTRDELGAENGYRPKYEHIVYPAHHDDLCTGLHPDGMTPWDPANPQMGQCLTDPLALPPDDYLAKRSSPIWNVVYQQRDTDPTTATFQEVWLTGGKDEDGEVYPGCLDKDRGLWMLPEGVDPSRLVSAMSVDVGHENFWGLYASVHLAGDNENTEWILAAEQRRMPAGTSKGLIDWDFEEERFVGLMEEWWQTSNAIGAPFSHVICEINAAQRHLFRLTNVIQRWQTLHNCRVLSHQTARNKNDPKLGVPAQLQIRYQLGAVRIPWAPGITRSTMQTFYNQIIAYGQKGSTDDMVMAAWMRTMNRRRLHKPPPPDAQPGQGAGRPPAWVRERRPFAAAVRLR